MFNITNQEGTINQNSTRNHLTSIGMARPNKAGNKQWQTCGQGRTFMRYSQWVYKIMPWLTTGRCSTKLKTELPEDLAISLLDICIQKNLKWDFLKGFTYLFKGRATERAGITQRSSICWLTTQMTTMVSTGPGWSSFQVLPCECRDPSTSTAFPGELGRSWVRSRAAWTWPYGMPELQVVA